MTEEKKQGIERSKEMRGDLLKKIQTDYKDDKIEDVVHALMSLGYDLSFHTGNGEQFIELLKRMLSNAIAAALPKVAQNG